MVDADVEVPGVIAKGKLLTLTDREALELRVASARASDFAEVMRVVGIPSAVANELNETWAEAVVRFLTHPWVTSLLMSVALVGILVELRTPGFGIPGLLGIAALALFFWGHWLVELAGWEELLLLGLGLSLLLVEAFLVPGFGVTGVLGVGALAAALSLAVLGAGASFPAIVRALGQVSLAFVVAGIGAYAALRIIAKLPSGGTILLSEGLDAGSASASGAAVGQHGTALSPLRPSGFASIAGARVDVVSEGNFVDAGQRIEVVRMDGNRVLVRRVEDAPEPTSSERSEHV
jgi:membrane-bound serine protease (ClpP class)